MLHFGKHKDVQWESESKILHGTFKAQIIMLNWRLSAFEQKYFQEDPTADFMVVHNISRKLS